MAKTKLLDHLNEYTRKNGNAFVDRGMFTVRRYQTPIDRKKKTEQTVVRYKLNNKIIASIIYRPDGLYQLKQLTDGIKLYRTSVFVDLESAKEFAKDFCDDYVKMEMKKLAKALNYALDEYSKNFRKRPVSSTKSMKKR